MTTRKDSTLRAALGSIRSGTLGALIDVNDRVALADVMAGSCLAGGGKEARGHTVLLSPESQLASALAMIDLDGVAQSLVVCPPDLPPEHRAIIAERLRADLLVSDGAAETGPGQKEIRRLHCAPRIVSPHLFELETNETDWILLTSGTFGPPKAVRHTLATLTAAIDAPADAADAIVWSTFYDIRRFGGLQILLRALTGGHSLVLSNAGETTLEFLHRAAANGVTHLTGTPSHWRNALMTGSIGTIAPRYIRLSGETASQPVLDALTAAFPGATIVHAYASTEAGVGFEVTDGREGFPAEYIGRGTGAVALRVVDGSLRIKSTRAAFAYAGEAESSLTDAGGFIDTGDMVDLRGDRYHFTGRRGGIINVGGAKVHPEEVEEVIDRHPAVAISLVKARANPLMGAIVVAEVVLNDYANQTRQPADLDMIRDEILASCQTSLAAHKVPLMLRFVASLPVTPTGKLARGT